MVQKLRKNLRIKEKLSDFEGQPEVLGAMGPKDLNSKDSTLHLFEAHTSEERIFEDARLGISNKQHLRQREP